MKTHKLQKCWNVVFGEFAQFFSRLARPIRGRVENWTLLQIQSRLPLLSLTYWAKLTWHIANLQFNVRSFYPQNLAAGHCFMIISLVKIKKIEPSFQVKIKSWFFHNLKMKREEYLCLSSYYFVTSASAKFFSPINRLNW